MSEKIREKSEELRYELNGTVELRRDGRLCPPKGTVEFAEDFRVSELHFAGRTESSAPTGFLRSSAKFVGVDRLLFLDTHNVDGGVQKQVDELVA